MIELKTSSAPIGSVLTAKLSQSPHIFRHSVASIMSSFRRLRIGVMSFLVLLDTFSHSVDIAGIERASQI
jgi:hypothetical protein